MSKAIPIFLGDVAIQSNQFYFSYLWLQHFLFAMCLIFIVSVSIFDSMLVVQFQETILLDERNPICTLLIRKDPNHLSWFLAGKTFGNLFVLTTLIVLARFKYRYVMLVTGAVALFQLFLLVYLNFADNKTGFLHFDGLYSNDPEKYKVGLKSLLVHLTAALTLAITAITSWTIRTKYKTARKKQLSTAV